MCGKSLAVPGWLCNLKPGHGGDCTFVDHPKPGSRSEDPLEVGVIDGRLVISIGVQILAHAVVVEGGMLYEVGDEDVATGVTITDPLIAAKEIARELRREEEDGTTEVHKLLDRAAMQAYENGGQGFQEPAAACGGL